MVNRPPFIVSMRLDQYLKLSRLIHRRSVAQEFCDEGLVAVNGVAARSSKTIKAGDAIAIERRGRILTVRVIKLPHSKQVSKDSAADLFEVIGETAKES